MSVESSVGDPVPNAVSTERVSVTIGDQEISFETGKLAKQADGAVVVRSGETMVLATAQGRMETREGADFFPLTVDVEERMYAAGKIPGGFFKREGRPTERAILTARMIDRPIRPLWPKGFRNEVQVICTVLSADLVTPHDILCINGASAALMISPLPFEGPVGAVRMGMIDGELVVNPTLPELENESTLDLIVVGTKEGLTMVEAGAGEIPEDRLLEALARAHEEIKKLCRVQEELAGRVGKPKWLDTSLTAEIEASHGHRIRERIQREGLREASAAAEEIFTELSPELTMQSTEEDIQRQVQARQSLGMLLESLRLEAVEGPVRQQFEAELRALTDAEQDSKELKSAKRNLLFERIVETVELPFPAGVVGAARGPGVEGSAGGAPGPSPAAGEGEAVVKDTLTRQFVKRAAEAIYKDLVRKKIAIEKRRPDGRGAEEIRPIETEVGVSPRTHGSALFTRGQTQIMSLLTLGTAKEGQRIDDLSLETDRRYMHHYNFPPYSVGETGFMRGPKRRDIGHGALAQRALEPVIPGAESFPYTIRIVSETLESNGSSSMGSVCGSTLALMDAGVPIKAPVSGIAMGLVKEADDYVILTDIQGAEDHLGDMDFKVAGTREGVTALQMDIKITGVTQEIMRQALAQAKQAREFILDKMGETISEARTELAENAPRISTVKIDPEKIGMVIGKGGETIRALETEHDVQVDIEEDGTILIYATEGTKANAAIAAIDAITKEPEVGDTYTGKVVKTTQFGAFVELKKGTDGLLHVSNVGPGRVGHIEDVIERGDVLDVVVQEVDKARGRIGLKLIAKHENGSLVQPEELIARAKDAPPRPREEERPRGDRGGRGGRGPRRDRERSQS
jgi:polyribonucleotide nucleotidyltransferase